ncbi:DUF6588 family protein [Flavobacterium channae]|uniref:DUF6588 family protein n=1 Tax=Flavobacterium channae TaxID=2897181 RepID=UPI001E530504|nr:DUF6588 family protein [Flavobacterium channae]UGS24372.1 hypothetical protein LOS89_03640 [Flavobacterium channae]
MRKLVYIIGMFVAFFFSQKSKAQTLNEQIGYLLADALFYSDKYITPATDAAVYQASSSWMNSAKKKEKWKFDLGIHVNTFIVPKKDREFQISNDDFQFFQIENAETAVVPSTLGNDNQVYLVGDLDGQEVRFKTPEGINQEVVVYPYLQASLGLPYGFELVGRYSTRTKLKKGDYQVYGFGLKHNFSQYFKKLEEKKINISFLTVYSNEEIRFDFLDVQTATFGNLGLDSFSSKINTFHFQLAFSKEIKDFEIIGSFITNVSNFNFEVYSDSSEPSLFLDPINQIIPQLEETKWNAMGEISGRYQISKIYLQSSIAFGKFVNANLGVQYQF